MPQRDTSGALGGIRTHGYDPPAAGTPSDWESLVNAGIEARKLGDGANWALGDLAAQVETTYGGEDLAKYAARIGVAFKSLARYRTVALRFEKATRVAFSLPWAHYRAVAARDDAEALLAKAARKHWTVEQLRDYIDPPAPPVEPSPPHIAQATGENEWYTPEEYIEAARLVLEEIDLDPASSDEANDVVRARTYYTLQEDGLAQEWAGRVWMNPPYAADLVGKFASKLVHHFSQGEVTAAIVLVNNATETNWFQQMARQARAVCFPLRRVRFWGPGGEIGAPLQGQAILYLGDRLSAFQAAYQPFGLVLYGEG